MAYTYFSKIILILTVFMFASGFTPATSQWTTPDQIPNYEASSRPPFLIADQHDRIHVFNYESINTSGNAIIYRSWSLEGGWTPPVDIILTGLGGGPQTLQGVILDNSEIFHLIFNISEMGGGTLYYCNAPLAKAGTANGWSDPILIGPSAGPQPFSNLTLGLNEQLLAFYGSNKSGDGLYLVTSENGGKNWSQPIILSLFSTAKHWVGAMQSLVDSDGSVHLVWSVISDAGVGEEIHYAKLNDQKNQLMEEAVLARREGNDYSANWPDLIRADDTLIIFYMDSFPATRYMRTSADNGKSWSLPVQPFPYIGEYETTAMVKDSLGTIHLIMGNRTIDPEIHGMWSSKWLGTRWSTLSAITYGKKTAAFDPSAPKAVVLGGNLLFVTWWNDTRLDDRTGAWYSYRRLDAPPNPPRPSPTLAITQEAIASITPNVIGTKTSGLLVPTQTDAPLNTKPTRYFPAGSIFWGLIPVLGLLLGFYYYKKRNF